MNKLHKLLIIALLLIMGGNTLKAQRVGDTFSKTYNEGEETAYTLTFKITQLDPPECTITEGTNPSDSTSLEIPSTIDGYDVTIIGYRAFAQCDKFTGDLVIPNTVKTIEKFAFEWCRGFNGTLKLSDSLTYIGDNAFADNNKLKGTLTIPDKVEYIGKSAFISCVGFTGDLIIPNSVTYIGLGAFSYMNFNGRLQISENITSIENSTFDYCDFTGKLVIPNSVKTIGDRAFKECKNFTGDLVIPNSVETIGESVFENCTGFDGSLTIGENVNTIENNAFKGCSNLKGSLVIPNSVETIGESAFENCTGFDGSLTIGENVKNIENNAFKGCVGLTGDLVIPEKVTYIFEGAFQGCTNLTGKLVISNSVTSISTSAFENCTGFTGDLIIPNSVTKIGESAFKNCSGFDGKLIISTGVETIQYGAFSGCSNLTGDLVIPDNVKSIGMFAFENCSGFDGNLTLSENLTYINNFVFSGCSNLKGSLVIPDNVKSIGMYAFENCYGFTGDLKIPNNVTTIGNYAFNGCYGFTGDLIIPNSVTNIDNNAFNGCSGFTGDLKIPNSVTTIGDSAFKNCYGFTGSLVIPDNVEYIGTSTFENCSGLDSLTIPNSVIRIYSYAFAGCTNLTTVITSCDPKFDYDFGDGVTIKQEHAYENGVCTICDKACDHSESTHETYTDNGDGTHSFTCSVCNTEVTEDHTGGTATCTEKAKCEHCGTSYGELGDHIGGTATCQTQAVCEHCGTSYGELDPNNHEYENNNGICCETIQPATLVTNENYESLGLAAEYVDFYQIGNAGQLFWFANHINTVDRTASAVLTADIDLENRPWTPIGSTGENSHNFRGVFDGQNHTITGLYVEGGRAGLGFFGEVRTGTVKNFTIYGEVVVNTEVNYVGGVIGSVCGLNGNDHGLEHNGATIQNITSYVNLTAKTHGIGMVGGFIGYANHETLIENCSWYGTFDAGIYRVDSGAGGFIGRIYDSAKVTIRNCAAYGTIMTSYKSGTFDNQNTIYIGGFLSYSPSGAQTVMQNNLWAGEIINNTNLEASNAHLSAFGTMTSFQSITNCYALKNTPYVTTNNENYNDIITVTAEQLASGEIAYNLGEAWGQNIDNGETADAYPVLGGAKVYKHTFDFGNINVYSNLETLDMTPHGKCGDYLYWNITDSTLTIFGTGAMYDYELGASPWYTHKESLKTLVLEEGMTYIGKYAFYNCSGFTGELIIPNSVTSIGDIAFGSCNFTGSLTIPNNVTSIGENAFSSCDFRGSLTIGNSVTSIGKSAFSLCYFTGSLIIPNSVTYIGDEAFYKCYAFTGPLTIPNSVTSIGTRAFYNCSGLSEIFFYRNESPSIAYINTFANINSNAKIYAPVIWESFTNIPEDKLVKMPTWISQQVWVGLAEGQTEPGENDHVAINAPMELSQQANGQQPIANSLKIKSFGYCGDGTTTNGSITIEEGGQLYCETARGEVTVRKEILGYQQSGSESKWYTISSPLKDVTSTSSVSGLLTTESDYDLYRYDEPSHTWQNAKLGEGSTNFQTIEPGRGYLYANAENTTLEFKGNINTEDVNYTLTAQSEVLNGFHLVGNPYTHDISFNHLSTDAELANGYYVLNGEGAWGATLGNEGDVIKVGQGALIKTTSAGVLAIAKKSTSQQDNESPSRSQQLTANSQQLLNITVANSNYSDKAFVVFDKGVGLDKINHENENIPLLYIPQDGTDYAIAMMDENVSEIPVSFEATTMGQYTISLQQENCDFEELYLLDKETGEKVNILEEDYTFMATTADNAERFVLTMNSDNDFDNDTDSDSDNGNFAYISGEDLIISVEGAIQIIDVMGRIIYSNDVTSDNNRIDVSVFDNAAYIVRVVNENGVKVQKIIL